MKTCEKCLREQNWMNWYSIITRWIRTTMWKSKIVLVNDDGDDDATPHFTACVALHIEHTHKYIHWERVSWARTVLFLAYFITLTLAALHSRRSTWSSIWTLSLRFDFLFLPLRFPPVCPSSSPPSFSATSSSRSSRRLWKICATPLPTGVEGTHDVLYLPTRKVGKSKFSIKFRPKTPAVVFKVEVFGRN